MKVSGVHVSPLPAALPPPPPGLPLLQPAHLSPPQVPRTHAHKQQGDTTQHKKTDFFKITQDYNFVQEHILTTSSFEGPTGGTLPALYSPPQSLQAYPSHVGAYLFIVTAPTLLPTGGRSRAWCPTGTTPASYRSVPGQTGPIINERRPKERNRFTTVFRQLYSLAQCLQDSHYPVDTIRQGWQQSTLPKV